MNVDETKRLILAQLDELRAQAREPIYEPRVAGRRTSRGRRSAPGRSIGRRQHEDPSELAERLCHLEERLSAVERCFLRSAAPAPTRVGAVSVEAPIEPACPPTLAPAPAPPPQAAAAPPPCDKSRFDFAGAPYRLTGSVDDGLLTDVLQVLTSNQKTGKFTVFLPDEAGRCDLYLRAGEFIHAEAGELRGEQAFFSLMSHGHRHGYYGFLPDEVAGIEPTIEGKSQFLILEALRRIDEERNREHRSTGE